MKLPIFICRTSAALTTLVLFFGVCIHSADAKKSNHVYVKAQFLSLKEIDQNDGKTLEESGALVGIGYKLIPEQTSSSFSGDGELYYGVVSYEGQSQKGVSFKDKNKYTGINLDGNINIFLCNLATDEQSLIAVGGLGIDSWIRSINLIHKEYGYREIWTNFYGRAGLGIYLMKDVYISGGAKIPFWTSKHIGDFDLSLNPKGKKGAFFETTILMKYISLFLFYESNRFEGDSKESQNADQYYGWYPETKGRSIGFSLRSRF